MYLRIVFFLIVSLNINTVFANSAISNAEIESNFKYSVLNISEGKPLKAAAKLSYLAEITNAPRIKLELGMAYLSSGYVRKGISTLSDVSNSASLPPIVKTNVNQVIARAKKSLFSPYFSVNVGIDSNPKNLPAKQEVILFGNVPMQYDPGAGSGQQSYAIYTVGVKGSVSRLINYNAYITQTDYEKGAELDGMDYGLRMSSLWGDDTTHAKTSIEFVRADKSNAGYKGIASLNITPDVFSNTPVTLNGSYTQYQSDDSVRAGYNLTSFTVSQAHHLSSGRNLSPSLTIDLFEPNSGINAYKNVTPALQTAFTVFGYDIQASASLGLKEYRKKDFMFNKDRQDISKALSLIIPITTPKPFIKPLRFTIGYEHSTSSVKFYDYSKVTLKLGASS